ncbi:erythroid membrane-associated protein-like isoform X1 [Thunnus thynnus]|uniref:erythroid membrane-associated protein-like isoform X1 n=1 Tax=Thunnus thynnus TaxID=8237 RepID=UPI003526FF51
MITMTVGSLQPGFAVMMKTTLVALLCILPFIETAPLKEVEVVAEEGDNVLLQCPQDPQVNLERSLVEWTKDGRTNFVHVYRHGQDYFNDQKDEYKGRTVLFHEGLSRGNVTLQLSSVRLSDNGTFKCFVKKTDTYCFITLKVGEKMQSNQTQDDDLRTTRHPDVTETYSDGKNTAAILTGTIFTVIVICCLIGALGWIYRNELRRRFRRWREGEAEMPANNGQMDNLMNRAVEEGKDLDSTVDNDLKIIQQDLQ